MANGEFMPWTESMANSSESEPGGSLLTLGERRIRPWTESMAGPSESEPIPVFMGRTWKRRHTMAAFFVSLIQTAGEFLIYAAIALAGILLGKKYRAKKDKQ